MRPIESRFVRAIMRCYGNVVKALCLIIGRSYP